MKSILIAVLLVVLSLLPHPTSYGTSIPEEAAHDRDARMKWWRDARFGMFIHWGLYAIPGGEWNGKPVQGIGEWIMDKANIPVEEYEQLAKQFNPVDYNPAAWARAAKQAGMKYVVITSKHHDGFCLFDTTTTDWDIVDATPYGKDLLKPLAEACRKEGLKFCIYYSIMDWHHPSQSAGKQNGYSPTEMKPGRKDEYVQYMRTQLAELLASCDPDLIWFDGEWPSWWEESDGRELYTYLRNLKPTLIINNRVGKGRKGMEGMSKDDAKYVGDFGTPEQQIPATGIPGTDWESCMTLNNTWGFKKRDESWKSPERIVRNLVDVASKGGNYLLNVGPTATGKIPQPSLDRLAAVGKWMDLNSQSIYETSASPLGQVSWGRCTQRENSGHTILYLHVFDPPENGKLKLPIDLGTVVSATSLARGDDLPFDQSKEGTTIQVPETLHDNIDFVVKVEFTTRRATARSE